MRSSASACGNYVMVTKRTIVLLGFVVGFVSLLTTPATAQEGPSVMVHRLPRLSVRKVGAYGFACFGTDTLRNARLNNLGYAGDKPSGTCWYNAGRGTNVNSRKIYDMIDTFGGHSGSSMYIKHPNCIRIYCWDRLTKTTDDV